jgi:hypothetical protein
MLTFTMLFIVKNKNSSFFSSMFGHGHAQFEQKTCENFDEEKAKFLFLTMNKNLICDNKNQQYLTNILVLKALISMCCLITQTNNTQN